MRARWYSPRLAQFTAPDALGYIDSYNLYGFSAFDPINGWDPFGLATLGFGCGPDGCGASLPMFELLRAGNLFATDTLDPALRELGASGNRGADLLSTASCFSLECFLLIYGAKGALRSLPATRQDLYLELALTAGTGGFGTVAGLAGRLQGVGKVFRTEVGRLSAWMRRPTGAIAFPELDRLYERASKSRASKVEGAGEIDRGSDTLWKTPKSPTRADRIAELPVNQMSQEVQRGQAPRGIVRVDPGNRRRHEVPHVHFDNGGALNFDGTWKHTPDGGANITNRQRAWLENNGWAVPE